MRKLLFLFILAGLAGGCSFNNVDNADYLKPYFDSAGVVGCFALYDNGRNEFTIYNRDRYLERFPPGGTFNILTALTGLETGKVFDEKKAGIGDQTLMDAFRSDSIPYFQALARALGKDTLDNRIKALSYGNMNTLAPVDSLWLVHGLTISPDEQLGLVKGLFFDQLSFQKRTQEVMRTVMEREKTTNYTLAWSEAYTHDSTGAPLGWALGWVEERNHPYFFVLNIGGSGAEGKAGELMRKILAQQGFFKGVR
jgi:beta-lactamase class D